MNQATVGYYLQEVGAITALRGLSEVAQRKVKATVSCYPFLIEQSNLPAALCFGELSSATLEPVGRFLPIWPGNTVVAKLFYGTLFEKHALFWLSQLFGSCKRFACRCLLRTTLAKARKYKQCLQGEGGC